MGVKSVESSPFAVQLHTKSSGSASHQLDNSTEEHVAIGLKGFQVPYSGRENWLGVLENGLWARGGRVFSQKRERKFMFVSCRYLLLEQALRAWKKISNPMALAFQPLPLWTPPPDI